jgi:two-component system, NtrC family, response regulator HydG
MRRTSRRRPFKIIPDGIERRMVNHGDGDAGSARARQDDITRLKNRIAALEDSLRRYETILNDVDVQLSEMDLDGNITFINDAGLKMWRLPREKLMGMHYRAYVDPDTARRFYQIFKNVYETGIPLKNAVLDITDQDGRRRTIEKSVSLMRDAKGVITGFRMVTREITDRKEAENKLIEHRSRLEAIFGSVKDAIVTVDPALQVIEANKSTETICGVGVREIIGKTFSQCRTHCGQACQEVLRQSLEEKNAIKEFLIECDHQHRANQVVSVSTSPLRDPRGTFMGAVLVIRDITLLRGLERELRERHRFQNLIGRNKTMQDIYRLLEDLANVDTTVLVTGESGTGKELVARALHYSGNRSFKPFVTVNCSALAENLLESELFGHVKGAFTGAIKDRQGRFQAADRGTILLDEIGDISPMIQLKLLRVLQEKEFERVGDSTPQKVNVRVIASTNRHLKEKVGRGEFRQDLYYRLKVVEVALPPLRDRREDLPLLVEHFRRIFNERFNKEIEGISSEVLGAFMEYPWPGNVRELEHAMEHAFVLCRGGAITFRHLPADIRGYASAAGTNRSRSEGRRSLDAREILEALHRTDWNKAKAARLLGIGRRTIYRKMELLGLERE